MQFENINLRFKNVKNGNVCILKVKDDVWYNEIGLCMAVYKNGYFYDSQVVEEGLSSLWNVTDFVSGYCLTGVNVEI